MRLWCGVETHLGTGLPAFNLVGLPEAAVRESKQRVRAALETAGFSFPVGRLTINLAPAEIPKEGGRFDLPMAIGILDAMGELGGRAPWRGSNYTASCHSTGRCARRQSCCRRWRRAHEQATRSFCPRRTHAKRA